MKYICAFFLTIIFSCINLSAKQSLIIDHDKGIDTLDSGIYPYSFKVFNISGDTVEIKSIAATCGCTQMKTDVYKIAPHDSAIVSFEVNLMNSKGSKISEIIIETADESVYSVMYEFYVLNKFKLYPKKLPFYSRQNAGDTITYNLRAENSSNSTIEMKTPYLLDASNLEIISVKPEILNISPNSELNFEVTVRVLKAGRITSKLVIPLNMASVKEYEYLIVVN